jgi:hypothetical protein
MSVPSMYRRATIATSLIAVGGLALTAATFAPAADIIRGSVRSADGVPVPAIVTAVSSLDSANARTNRSKVDGTYSILFNPAGGPYRLWVTAEGFADTTVDVRSTSATGLLVADVTLRRPMTGEVRRIPDVIRGAIKGADGTPVLARVVATAAVDAVSRAAQSTDRGAFGIVFPRGGGTYSVSVTANGYADTTFTVGARGDTLDIGIRQILVDVQLRKR